MSLTEAARQTIKSAVGHLGVAVLSRRGLVRLGHIQEVHNRSGANGEREVQRALLRYYRTETIAVGIGGREST